MDNNNIQFIDQRLAHLRSLIPQCKAQSAADEKLLADTIITLEIKSIEVIHALEKRLGELRALIPVQVCTKSMDSPYIGLQFTFKQISQDTINHFKK